MAKWDESSHVIQYGKITFVYAKCGFYDLRVLWRDLEGFNTGSSPWIVIRDFNLYQA